MKQHEDAVHTLIRAILFKPDAHEAHLSRDDALRPLGQHAQALGSSTSHCHSMQASWPLVAIAVWPWRTWAGIRKLSTLSNGPLEMQRSTRL